MRIIVMTLTLTLCLIICACTKSESDEERLMRDLALAQSPYSPEDTAVWRSNVLPNLLLGFRDPNSSVWQQNRAVLLRDKRTPKYIIENLKSENVYTSENRNYLATEGTIYRHLASFNTNNRNEWTNSRRILMQMGKEVQQRCIFNLILRLNAAFDREHSVDVIGRTEIEATASQAERIKRYSEYQKKLSDYLSSNDRTKAKLLHQRAFWASEELVEIGEPAVDLLITFSKIVYTPLFTELVFLTLSQIGEPALPKLIKELKNSNKMVSVEAIYFRKRKLISTLGDVFEPQRFDNPEWIEDELFNRITGKAAFSEHRYYYEERPDWQKNSKFIKDAVKELTIQMRDYRADTDSQQFIFWIDIIHAFRKIGNVNAVVPLVEIWRKNRRDEYLVDEIMAGLLDLTNRNLGKLDDWIKFAKTLKDPEDF